MARDPDVDLAEAFFPPLLVRMENGRGSGVVRVDAEAKELIPIASSAVFPGACDADGVLRNASKGLA
ncbi:MAG: hypothetical protein ACJ8FY_15535 [Gemmataceae bacterium]